MCGSGRGACWEGWRGMGFRLRDEASLANLTEDGTQSSAIEGERLDAWPQHEIQADGTLNSSPDFPARNSIGGPLPIGSCPLKDRRVTPQSHHDTGARTFIY